MPLVQIALRAGTTPEYRAALADAVHRAMVEAIAIPADDCFQIITEHAPANLLYDPHYLGVHRSDRVVFIHITLSHGRKPQQKRKLYKRITELLAQSPASRPTKS
jgi:4-oxalocrotonate tautomerase